VIPCASLRLLSCVSMRQRAEKLRGVLYPREHSRGFPPIESVWVMRLYCSHTLLRVGQSVTCENLSDFCLTRLDSSVDESDAATPLCFLSNPRPTSQKSKSQSQQRKCIFRTSSLNSVCDRLLTYLSNPVQLSLAFWHR